MNKIFQKIKYQLTNNQKGMTLVELMVVLFIFILLTGIIIFDYSKFRSTISTQNLANDIALSIRKAQSYAIGVRGVNDLFDYGYGIYFTAKNSDSNILSGSKKSFIIFSDVNGNKMYDFPNTGFCGPISSGKECKEILTINSADEISAIYLNDEEISKPSEGVLNIIFKRPDPDAIFCYKAPNSSNCSTQDISSARIEVSNGQTGDRRIERNIIIWNTGQISVN